VVIPIDGDPPTIVITREREGFAEVDELMGRGQMPGLAPLVGFG
jgi:hypothetical protein